MHKELGISLDGIEYFWSSLLESSHKFSVEAWVCDQAFAQYLEVGVLDKFHQHHSFFVHLFTFAFFSVAAFEFFLMGVVGLIRLRL